MDSAGLGALMMVIGTENHEVARNRRVALAGIPNALARIFDVTGLSDTLAIFEGTEEAADVLSTS